MAEWLFVATGVVVACRRHDDALGDRIHPLATIVLLAAVQEMCAGQHEVGRDQHSSAERAELLDTYRGFEKRQFPDPSALSGATLHQYLVLRGGIRAEESAIDWLDEVIAAL